MATQTLMLPSASCFDILPMQRWPQTVSDTVVPFDDADCAMFSEGGHALDATTFNAYAGDLDGGDDGTDSSDGSDDQYDPYQDNYDSNDDDDETPNIDQRDCPVAPSHTPYDYGYTFIEGFMPAASFDALVRPERRLVLLVGGVPVALDAAEVERAAAAGRRLVTPIGSCGLGSTDVDRAHRVDESLSDREGIRRFLTTAPVNAAVETGAAAVAADAAQIGGGALSAVLGGLAMALL
jgi:hypothetical protein